jgi:CAAX protease family protein
MESQSSEFLAYASRGKNAWWRYLVVCISAIAIMMALLTVVTLALFVTGKLGSKAVEAIQHPTAPAPFFLWNVAGTFGALIIGLAVSAYFIQGKRPADLIGNWRWRLFAVGFGAWTLVQTAATAIDYLLAPHAFSVTVSHATAALALFAAIGLIVQTFTEEFIFRGYATQGIFLALKRPIPASIVSGLIFGALHYWNGIPQMISAMFFGIACSYVAIRTGGLALTAGVHLANNYFGAVVFVQTDDVFKGSAGIFTQNTPNLMWSDVAVSALAFLAFAVIVARLWPEPATAVETG